MSDISGRDRAYHHLRTALLSDASLVGTFINEAEVAVEVGVSRTPVREALLLLSAEGLVQLVRNRGAFVPPPQPAEVHNILQARAIIETWAAETTLRELTVPLAEMESHLSRQRNLVTHASASEFLGADRDFHSALVDAAGNPVVTSMYEALRARHVIVGVLAVHEDTASRRAVIIEHQAILDALSSGDRTQTIHAIRSHLLHTSERHTRQGPSTQQ